MKLLKTATLICSLMLLQGCITFALNYADGKSRQQQRDKYIDAAKNGDKVAQYYVAETYCCGYGNHFHSDKATQYYCKSAQQGYSRASFRLGNIYEGDFSFTSSIRMINNDLRDRVKAYSWYSVAAEQGYTPAIEKVKTIGAHLDNTDLKAANGLIANWQQLDCSRL